MATITLQPDLAEQVTQMAEIAGIGATDLISEAINEYLKRFSDEKIEAEAQAFEGMHETLKEQYFGQFVAVHNGKVVDADADFEKVFLRVQARFGRIPILIRCVGEEPTVELHFRSPRLEWTGQ
jgi:predicted transcriptional regulator